MAPANEVGDAGDDNEGGEDVKHQTGEGVAVLIGGAAGYIQIEKKNTCDHKKIDPDWDTVEIGRDVRKRHGELILHPGGANFCGCSLRWIDALANL